MAYDKLNFQYWKVGVGGAELEIGDLDLLIKDDSDVAKPAPLTPCDVYRRPCARGRNLRVGADAR